MLSNLYKNPQSVALIILVVLALLIVVISVRTSQSKALALERERNIELQRTIEQIKEQIQAHDARLERALVTYEQGVKHAKQEHEQRQEAIRDLEQTGDDETKAWLCDVVPDDVCELFGLRADDRK